MHVKKRIYRIPYLVGVLSVQVQSEGKNNSRTDIFYLKKYNIVAHVLSSSAFKRLIEFHV